MKQLVSIENITIKCGSGFNIIVHKNRWLPEDCGYCHKRKIPHFGEGNDLMSVSQVKPGFAEQNQGVFRYVWVGAAWRNVKDGPEFDQVWRWFIWRWKYAALLV
jgi:ribosomal protein S27AE